MCAYQRSCRGELIRFVDIFFLLIDRSEKLFLASSPISSFLTSCLRKFINNFKVRPSPGESSLKFLLLSNANNMSSGRQDSTKELENSPCLSRVRHRLSRARIFASSSSYNAGRSVLERPVAAFHITIDSKSLTWICTSRSSLPKRSCSWAIAFE
ncbi:hypothetical protein TNCV_659541 [Trichonephila clavipes]|nr:hypothetical protein TNCV_659541 [Trichonephila clavipes]